jgi:hypothetical protein
MDAIRAEEILREVREEAIRKEEEPCYSNLNWVSEQQGGEKILKDYDDIALVLESIMRKCIYNCGDDCPAECFYSRIWDSILGLYVEKDKIVSRNFAHFRKIEIDEDK